MSSPSPVVTAHVENGDAPWIVRISDDAGHLWIGDEPAASGGGDVGPSPKQLLLSSLGACTAITVQMYAKHKQMPLTGIAVDLALNPGGTSAASNDITRTLTLQGELSDEQRQRLLQVANACPLHKILSGEIRITTDLAG